MQGYVRIPPTKEGKYGHISMNIYNHLDAVKLGKIYIKIRRKVWRYTYPYMLRSTVKAIAAVIKFVDLCKTLAKSRKSRDTKYDGLSHFRVLCKFGHSA